MKDWFSRVGDYILFVAATLNGHRLSFARVIEALLIAAVTAMITSYVTVERLVSRVEVEFRYISRDIDEIKRRLDRLEQKPQKNLRFAKF